MHRMTSALACLQCGHELRHARNSNRRWDRERKLAHPNERRQVLERVLRIGGARVCLECSGPLDYTGLHFTGQAPDINIEATRIDAKMIDVTCRRWLPKGEPHIAARRLIGGCSALM